MALPLWRVGELAQRAAFVMQDMSKEIAQGPEPIRQQELDQEFRVLHEIIKAMLRPHRGMLKELMTEEQLKLLGIE